MAGPPGESIEIESIVLRLRRHGRHLVLPSLALCAVAGASGWCIGNLPEEWMNRAAIAVAPLLALVFGIAPILNWLSSRATITTQRIIVRRGLFVHRRTEIALRRVREVRSRRSLWQRLLGSGNVELLVGSEAPFVLRDVPAPLLAVAAVQELVERQYDADASRYGGFSQFADRANHAPTSALGW